ncbi:hypothetical protein [Maricaulis maris]|uniref:hypothetical protein n=1 Tax=Maricaulis maris TaxID=74318 RepID=UPI0029203F9E|nr:hypothetical protein MACH15_17990 [Maricaulis maris]
MNKLAFALVAFALVGCASHSDDELVRQLEQVEPPWLGEMADYQGPILSGGGADSVIYAHCGDECAYVVIDASADGTAVSHHVGDVPGVVPVRWARMVSSSEGRHTETPFVSVFSYLSQNLERAFEACASTDRCYLRNEDFPDAGLRVAPFEVLLISRTSPDSAREVCLAAVTFWNTRENFTSWRSEPFCRRL